MKIIYKIKDHRFDRDAVVEDLDIVNSNIEKELYGKLSRWILLEQATEFELSREDNRREVQDLESTYTEIHVPDDFTVTEEDITDEYEAERRRESLIAAGKNASACCQEILALVAGYNLANNFTANQIDSLIAQFATIMSLLKNDRPNSAKPLIEAVPVSETVTQILKDDIAAIFTKYNL